jgi:hypothetical protein
MFVITAQFFQEISIKKRRMIGKVSSAYPSEIIRLAHLLNTRVNDVTEGEIKEALHCKFRLIDNLGNPIYEGYGEDNHGIFIDLTAPFLWGRGYGCVAIQCIENNEWKTVYGGIGDGLRCL